MRYNDAYNEFIPCSKELGNLVNMHRDGDRLLQLLILNEEFLVSAGHQPVLIASLPFVHTARRSYRLSDPVNYSDWRVSGNRTCWKVL